MKYIQYLLILLAIWSCANGQTKRFEKQEVSEVQALQPKDTCAEQFQDGKAQVTFKCDLVKDMQSNEHTRMESDSWFFIDKSGKEIK